MWLCTLLRSGFLQMSWGLLVSPVGEGLRFGAGILTSHSCTRSTLLLPSGRSVATHSGGIGGGVPLLPGSPPPPRLADSQLLNTSQWEG